MLMPPVSACPWDSAHCLPAFAATKEEEQAVSIATAGPFSPKWYEIRPACQTVGHFVKAGFKSDDNSNKTKDNQTYG